MIITNILKLFALYYLYHTYIVLRVHNNPPNTYGCIATICSCCNVSLEKKKKPFRSEIRMLKHTTIIIVDIYAYKFQYFGIISSGLFLTTFDHT